MKKALHKNNWNRGAVQLHMHPTPIILFESKNDTKLDKDLQNLNCVGILRQKIWIF